MGSGITALLVSVALLVLPQASMAVVPAILESPMNRTVGLGQDPLILTCRVRGDNIFIRVDGAVFSHNSEMDFRARGITFSNGIHSGVDEITQRVTVALLERNNNTNIICHGRTRNQSHADSDPAFIFIAGKPLSPRLQYLAIDESAIQVSWEEPYSAEEFPITSYYLRVVDINQTSETSIVLVDTALSPETNTFNVTRVDTTSCTNLTFQSWAQNSLGNGSVDVIFGAFPSPPGAFSELSSVVTTFSQDLLPMIQINFTFPTLCPYNNATYMIEIEDEEHRVVHTVGPNHQSWMSSGYLISKELRDVLELNAQYSFNITVWTSVGNISSVSTFDTFTSLQTSTDPTTPNTTHAALNGGQVGVGVVKMVASVCAVTILLMLALAASTIGVIYVYKCNRTRRRECVHTTELANHVSRVMPMVVNPIYETGAIYEEIPDPSIYKSKHAPTEKEEGYVSISSAAATNTTTSEKSLLQEKGNEEMYTVMNAVNPLLRQLSLSAEESSLESPTEATIYNNISDGDGASALCGQHGEQQQQVARKPDNEDRYVIIH